MSPDADSLASALKRTSLADNEKKPLDPDDISVIFSRIRYRAMPAHDLRPSAGGYTIKARKQMEYIQSKRDLRSAVGSHGNKVFSFLLSSSESKKLILKSSRNPSPFISTTTDPLRAFNFAFHLYHESHDEVRDACVVMIDTWALPRKSFVNCEDLRSDVDICTETGVFQSETLVWQQIPQSAIMQIWSYTDLMAKRFGTLFSPIFSRLLSSEGDLQSLRDRLRDVCAGTTSRPQDIAHILVNELNMAPESIVSQQLGLVMHGWAHGIKTTISAEALKSHLNKPGRARFREELDQSLHLMYCQTQLEAALAKVSSPILAEADPLQSTRQIENFSVRSLTNWQFERKVLYSLEHCRSLNCQTNNLVLCFIDFVCKGWSLEKCISMLSESQRLVIPHTPTSTPIIDDLRARWKAARSHHVGFADGV